MKGAGRSSPSLVVGTNKPENTQLLHLVWRNAEATLLVSASHFTYSSRLSLDLEHCIAQVLVFSILDRRPKRAVILDSPAFR